MNHLSTSKVLSALAPYLCFTVFAAWAELAGKGLVNHLLETFGNALLFALSVSLALYATERASSGIGRNATCESDVDRASKGLSSRKQITIMSLLALLPRTLNALFNRQFVLLYKGLFTFGLSFLAIVSAAEAYSNGNLVTWSNCFLICSAALGFWLSLVLHLVTDSHVAEGTESSSRSKSRESIVSSLADNPRAESLALLIISQSILCFDISCLATALKQGGSVWLSVLGESAAWICFATLFVRTQLNFLRTQGSESE